MKRSLHTLGYVISALTVFFVLFSFAYAESDDVLWVDCSDSQREYSQTVASFGLIKSGDYVSVASLSDLSDDTDYSDMTIVLCRTKGSILDISGMTPLVIAQGPDNCYTLLFASDTEAQDAVDLMLSRSDVIYAELDSQVYASGTTDEAVSQTTPFLSWGASAMDYGAYVEYAQKWGNGNVTVAIIDSGVGFHEMINDHIRAAGYDYVDADDNPRNDEFGHGTCVTGIVVDCVQDLPVWIYPVRILGSTGTGTVSNLCNGIREAVKAGVDIINLSLELARISDALDSAIDDAIHAGVLVVVAAGNHNIDTENISPSHITSSGVIVVGALSSGYSGVDKWISSNYGASVDIYTPGVGIVCCNAAGGFSTATGTSMAAPHISALCSMIKLIHAGLSPSQLEDRAVAAANRAMNDYALPDANRIIPDSTGFHLRSMVLCVSEQLLLSEKVFPLTAYEKISYSTSDENVIVVNNGILTAVGAGKAKVTVSCTGIDTFTFEVTVSAEQENRTIALPALLTELADGVLVNNTTAEKVILQDGLRSIGDQVFNGCTSLKWVRIPSSVESIGENDFADAVLIVNQDSYGENYARSSGVQYILILPETRE